MTHTLQPLTCRPGDSDQLGATVDSVGTNFAVWAPGVTALFLCLFDDEGAESAFSLHGPERGVWHGHLEGVLPGQSYGFRADGEWRPDLGQLTQRDKVLLDPYARAIDGTPFPDPRLAALAPGGRANVGDKAPGPPRSVVVANDDFDWGADRPPGISWDRTVIYEAHVRGMTMRHPEVPPHLRGTYAGLASPAMTGYLSDLGVTAIELLPVHQHLAEPGLVARGLTNYWGYNSIGFFAPHAAYAAAGSRGGQVTEFKQMVRSLHAAGIEVILDVVYNHTAEGGVTGPSLCFRGYDDRAYYRQDPPGHYLDVTGCGNTFNVAHPQVLRLILDSLRYWVTNMHVDGFRFDLASALLRTDSRPDLNAPFLRAIEEDPVLRNVKLIAEPWDTSADGYLVGQFPARWSEWNDRYRDGVRDFWRGHGGGVRELTWRFSGSSDLYGAAGRKPLSSINFVSSHDGFTLRDAVSYHDKHNLPNGEGNRDGSDSNRTWNWGVEGPTEDPAIISLRKRQAANMLATLLLSTGVPMMTAGDERGRSQGGNNNAFCQDNEISWLDWQVDPYWDHLHSLTRDLLSLRAEHAVLRRPDFWTGSPGESGRSGRKDITWLKPSGEEMAAVDWDDPARTTLGAFLNGDLVNSDMASGDLASGDLVSGADGLDHGNADTSYLVWLHAGADAVMVTLPAGWAEHYVEVVRTDVPVDPVPHPPGSTIWLLDRSFALIEAVQPGGAP
ncbi:MAG: glycogen debranching protein GlgX [Nocardioidaceae bacterium]